MWNIAVNNISYPIYPLSTKTEKGYITKMIPFFFCSVYLRRFERYADVMKWKKDMWATNLSALLKGRALDVYALLPPDQALDYDALKTAVLKRFDLTEDGFKRKFRASRPEGAETFAQFSVRLSSYLHRWTICLKQANF